MSEITIDTGKLREYAARMSILSGKLKQLERQIGTSYNRFGLLGLFNLRKRYLLSSAARKLDLCKDYAANVAQNFEKTEHDILNASDEQIRLIQAIERIVRIFKDYVTVGESESIYTTMFKKFWKGELSAPLLEGTLKEWTNGKNFAKILTGTITGSVTPTLFSPDFKDAIYEKKMDKIKNPDGTEWGYQKNKDEKFYDEKAKLFEVKSELKAEGSVLSAHAEGDSEYASGSADVKVLTGEAYINAAAGLYVYEKDKDGNVKRIFSPGVSAEIGASVAAFEASAEGRIGLGEGHNMLGVYGNAEVKAASAEASAKVALNRNEVYAGASAEADLVKVTGTAGVSVLGTDIGVTGSLKVGVGAHANIGYTDGKLKVDVGAAIGVGFDLGFEVDVQGTINKIVDHGDQIVKAVSGAANAVYEGGKKVLNSIFHW